MRLYSFVGPALIFSGAVGAASITGAPLVQGMIEAAVGGILSGPASWLGQGLRKAKVKPELLPQTISAITSLAGFGIAKGLGLGADWEVTLVRIGAQAGMTSGFAHDAGWTRPGTWAKDVGAAIGAGPVSSGRK